MGTKRFSLKLAAVAAVLLGFVALPSHALLLTPGDADFDGNDGAGYGPSNCEPGCINDLFGTSFTNADLLFKADHNNDDENGNPVAPDLSGSFAGFYTTSFSNSTDDPSAALIEWLGGSAISCGTGDTGCYLAVKDGAADPRYYFFDISSWNGQDNIDLSGFWADSRGAISHVSIFGGNGVPVPAPGALALLGGGLLGIALIRRRRLAS